MEDEGANSNTGNAQVWEISQNRILTTLVPSDSMECVVDCSNISIDLDFQFVGLNMFALSGSHLGISRVTRDRGPAAHAGMLHKSGELDCKF